MTKKSSEYTHIPKATLPALGKITLEWDLRKLFYTSEKDPRIEQDIQKAELAYATFAKKYAGKDFTATKKSLLNALHAYETLVAMPELARPLYYFSYRQSLNAKDPHAEKQLNLISNRMTTAGNKILFFELTIGKIKAKEQRDILKDPQFQDYTYFLEHIFENAKHMLQEAEERILNLRSETSCGMWIAGTEKIIAKRTIRFAGKEMSLNEAIESLDVFPKAKRTVLWHTITKELENIAEVAENEFNAIVTHKKISDELRGYKKPYEATVLSYENKIESVEALVQSISTKGFALSRDFYTHKAKLHGVPSIPYEHKYEPIAEAPVMSFETAVSICREAFYGLNPIYGTLFDGILTGGQLDAYPKPGKHGGAFMSHGVAQPTMVFLNHTNTFKSLETLAHEMGHAIHTERSKTQPVLYEGYSTTTAETASTFFENLVFEALLKEANPAQKKVLLHDKITRDIATIQRQIAFFNFELELHTRVREQGAVTKEELRDMMHKHLESYLGKGVTVRKEDGNSFVYVSHFRYGFYVYTYTYGILMSSLMHLKLNADPSYRTHIDAFLTSGGRAPVEKIFSDIGINPLKKETFDEALKLHERDIKDFKKLCKD